MKKEELRSQDPLDREVLVHVKLVIFALGAGFGIGGIATESRLLIWIAIAILFGGVLLRFLPRFRGGANSYSAAQEEEQSIEDGPSSTPRASEQRSVDS